MAEVFNPKQQFEFCCFPKPTCLSGAGLVDEDSMTLQLPQLLLIGKCNVFEHKTNSDQIFNTYGNQL